MTGRMTGRAGLVLVAILCAGCAAPSYDSSWTNTAADGPLDLAGKPVAAFVVMPSEDFSRAAESMLAEAMSRRGVVGVPGHSLLARTQFDDLERARQQLAAREVAGVVLMRPIGGEQHERYVPGQSYYTNLQYDSLWSYWDMWGSASGTPGHYEVDQTIYLETLYFSVDDDRLLWGGVTSVESGDDLGDSFQGVVDATAREMRKAGLLPR